MTARSHGPASGAATSLTAREWILLAALVLSPISYTIKLVYDLPVRWVDPTLVLGTIAAVLPPWTSPLRDPWLRRVAACAALFLAANWLAATVNIMVARFSNTEPFREPLRLTLDALLALACLRTLDAPERLRRAAIVLGAVAVVEVLGAVYLLAGLVARLPMPEPWRNYQQAYWVRQTFAAGHIVIPRLGGTFVEAPPFGLYVLAAIIVVHVGRRAAHRARRPFPRWMQPVLWFGAIGSLSTQILAGAGTFLLAAVLPRLRRATLRTRIAHVAAAVALVAGMSAIGYAKYRAGRTEVLTKGASVGERRAHAAEAVALFLDHPLLGIGPGQFGQFAERDSHGMYAATTNASLTPAEILAETGLVGTASLMLLLWSLAGASIARHGGWGLAALGGLLVADAFQANYRWPLVFVAVACLIVAMPPAHAVGDGLQS